MRERPARPLSSRISSVGQRLLRAAAAAGGGGLRPPQPPHVRRRRRASPPPAAYRPAFRSSHQRPPQQPQPPPQTVTEGVVSYASMQNAAMHAGLPARLRASAPRRLLLGGSSPQNPLARCLRPGCQDGRARRWWRRWRWPCLCWCSRARRRRWPLPKLPAAALLPRQPRLRRRRRRMPSTPPPRTSASARWAKPLCTTRASHQNQCFLGRARKRARRTERTQIALPCARRGACCRAARRRARARAYRTHNTSNVLSFPRLAPCVTCINSWRGTWSP